MASYFWDWSQEIFSILHSTFFIFCPEKVRSDRGVWMKKAIAKRLPRRLKIENVKRNIENEAS
jgi:hypothetical protein